MKKIILSVFASAILTGCCKDEIDSTPCSEGCGTLKGKSSYFDTNQNMMRYEYTVDLSCNGQRVIWRGISSHNESVLIGDVLCESQVW